MQNLIRNMMKHVRANRGSFHQLVDASKSGPNGIILEWASPARRLGQQVYGLSGAVAEAKDVSLKRTRFEQKSLRTLYVTNDNETEEF